MRWLVLLSIATLAGCGMMDRKGVAEYEATPVMVDGRVVCCEVRVYNTKDIGLVSVEIQKSADGDYLVEVLETAVDSSTPAQVQAEANAANAEAFKAAFDIIKSVTP